MTLITQFSREFELAAGYWALRAVIILTPLLIGGLPVSCLTFLGFVTWVAAIIHLWIGRWRSNAGTLVLGALSVYSLLYALPLPESWVFALTPNTAFVWQDARSLAPGSLPSRLGIEPESARVLSLQLLIYAAVWSMVAGQVLRTGRRFVARTVFVAALTVALITFVHRAFGLERVYGLYEPLYATKRAWAGPLLNPNNLSGLLNLGGFCGLSLLLVSNRTLPRRAALAVGTVILLAMSIATGSRGGTLALCFGVLLLSIPILRRPSELRVQLVGGLALLGGVVVSLAAIGLSSSIRAELLDASLAKLKLGWVAAHVALDNPWFGVGPGGFAVGFGAHRPDFATWIYEYAENFVVDWGLQWGLPVASLALGALLIALFPPRLRGARLTNLALLVGCIVVVLHNVVDMGFQVPGIVVPFVAVLSAMQKSRYEQQSATEPAQRTRRRNPLGWGIAAALILLTLTSAWAPPRLGHVERKRLSDKQEALASKMVDIESALTRHPGDAYFLRLGALVKLGSRSPQTALPWANAAISREPNNGRGYLLAAQALQQLGRTPQAVLTLRRAATDPGLAGVVAERITSWAPNMYRDVLPEGPPGERLLVAIADREPSSATRFAILETPVAGVQTPSPVRNLALAAVHLALADAGSDRQANLERAESLILTLLREPEVRDRATVLQGRWLNATGRANDALKYLLSSCDGAAARVMCTAVALELVDGSNPPMEQVRAVVLAFLGARCLDPTSCAAAHERAVRTYSRQGNWGEALDQQKRLLTLHQSAEALIVASELAYRAGQIAESLRFTQRAETHEPDPRQLERIAKLREQSLRGLVIPGN